jgi:hypothetical protein
MKRFELPRRAFFGYQRDPLLCELVSNLRITESKKALVFQLEPS